MLTDRLIKSTKLAEKGKTKTLTDGEGLSLYTTHTGKYWRLRYYLDGKKQVISLGEYPIVSLLEARQKRLEIKKQLHNGKSPILEKKKISEWTFEKVTQLWVNNWQTSKSDRYVATVKKRLELEVISKIGKMPMDEITTMIIVDLIKRVGERGTLDTANRILQKIGQIFRFAVANGYVANNSVVIKPSEILPAYKSTNLAMISEKEPGELLKKIVLSVDDSVLDKAIIYIVLC